MSLVDQRYEGEWLSGVYAWSLDHWNREASAREGAMATYHEVVVCLTGEFFVHARGASPVLLREGSLVAYDRGDVFDFRYGGELASGRVVGFGVPLPETLGLGEFSFSRSLVDDPAFLDFTASFAIARDAGAPLAADEVTSQLRTFILKHGEVPRRDPLLLVKHELDRNPAAPLYLAHLAEMAHMKPDTFSRAFARRYELAPIAYRVRRRLLEAGRLLIEAPEMLVSEIAARVGFDDVRNFHRAFRQRTSMSPVEFRTAAGVHTRGRRSGAPLRMRSAPPPAVAS